LPNFRGDMNHIPKICEGVDGQNGILVMRKNGYLR
jgi:hypothetical protein